MSNMSRRDANALDRYITGNYGEDQYNEEDIESDITDPKDVTFYGICPSCGEHYYGSIFKDIECYCGATFTCKETVSNE